ncbi:MAG: Fic family protein [Candidatus Brocadiia bacterium]
MKSFIDNFLERQTAPLDVAGTLRTLGEYRGKQELFARQTPQILKALRHIAIIQSVESSNRIEGVVVDNARLEPLVDKKTTPKTRPEAEVVGYRDVLAKIYTSYKRFDISPETILKLHKDMFHHTNLPAGQWKRRDNAIEERLPDGRWITRFAPVSAHQTEYYIKELCVHFNREWNNGKIDKLLLIFSFALDFLCIHPFADGNGRVSRLLTVLMLHQTDYDVGRYISIERLIEASKETYYEVLQECSQNWHQGKHRILPWWRYSLGILIAAYKEFENRAGATRAKRGAKTEWVTDAVKNLPREFSISEVTRACPGVSRPMIRVILENLRRQGRLKTLGRGRNALWQRM